MTPPPTTPTPKRERLNMGELSERHRAMVGVVTSLTDFDWDVLVAHRPDLVERFRQAIADAPRTEGRGEGQPVAWAYEYTNHLKGDRAPGGWLRAVAFEAPTRARVNAGFARNVQPLYASPIREPEISSTGPMFILPGEDPVEYMALMRQKAAEMDREVFLEELAEAMFKVDEKHGPIRMNVPYGELKSFQRKQYERYAEAVADAILNLAPVAKGVSHDADLSDEFDRPGRLSDATRHSAEGAADPALSGARGVGEGWRPIETAEPKNSERLMVATADTPPVVGEAWWREDYDGKLDLWWAGEGPGDYHDDPIRDRNQRVTHWQPLPPPPQDSEGEGR